MDERVVKRLLIIVVASIIVIALLKVGLTKTYATLNKATAEKQRVATTKPPEHQQSSALSVTSKIIEIPASSTAGDTTTINSSASSSVSETRQTSVEAESISARDAH